MGVFCLVVKFHWVGSSTNKLPCLVILTTYHDILILSTICNEYKIIQSDIIHLFSDLQRMKTKYLKRKLFNNN